MGKYLTNDLVERAFVMWALILAMLYGNNAVYLLDPENPSNLAIVIYLVFRGSLLVTEVAYSFYIPHIQRRVLLQSVLTFPLLGLWIPALYFVYPTRAALAISAIAVEYWIAAIMDTPQVQIFVRDDRKEIFNTDHWVERVSHIFAVIITAPGPCSQSQDVFPRRVAHQTRLTTHFPSKERLLTPS